MEAVRTRMYGGTIRAGDSQLYSVTELCGKSSVSGNFYGIIIIIVLYGIVSNLCYSFS